MHYAHCTLAGLAVAASLEASSATQFHVRHVLCATASPESVNPLTLAARENSSKRLIHFHETADEDTRCAPPLHMYTHTSRGVHTLTKGRVYNALTIPSGHEGHGEDPCDPLYLSSRETAGNAPRFQLRCPTLPSNMHTPLSRGRTWTTWKQEKKLSHEHQGVSEKILEIQES